MNPSPSLAPEEVPASDIADIERFFTDMTPAHLARLGEVYQADAWFKDPFNEVQGLHEVKRIFEHMYVALEAPHFVITGSMVDGAQAFLTWDFKFTFRRFDTQNLQTIRGGTHLQYDLNGLITLHRDYWDAAEELYEKLPVLGSMMRWLKARAVS